MKILILDNYDSFTYNLVHMVEDILGETVDVIKNDQINLSDLSAYDALILSPGPGIPSEAGKLLEIIQYAADKTPMLGVCLGHQAMAEAFGGELKQLEQVHHGVAVDLEFTPESPLYHSLHKPIQVGRYHSWVIDEESLPDVFEVTATDDKGIIMSMQHMQFPMTGVQYHPESILTPNGKQILENWLKSIS